MIYSKENPKKIFDTYNLTDNFTGYAVDYYGSLFCFKDGVLHNENEPAVTNKDYRAFFLNGALHNEKGPAVISTKKQEWFIHGKRHRIDGAAVIDITNQKKDYWYEDEYYGNDCDFNDESWVRFVNSFIFQ